jgi:hypothetical protein
VARLRVLRCEGTLALKASLAANWDAQWTFAVLSGIKGNVGG